jgi:hypothetical protein
MRNDIGRSHETSVARSHAPLKKYVQTRWPRVCAMLAAVEHDPQREPQLLPTRETIASAATVGSKRRANRDLILAS